MADIESAGDRTDDMEEMPSAPPSEATDEVTGGALTPALVAGPADSGADSAQKASKGKSKRQKPIIDLDDHIRKAQDAIKTARKQVQQARVQAKLEKRKKTAPLAQGQRSQCGRP